MSVHPVRPGSLATLAHLTFHPSEALPGFPTPRRVGGLSVWETVWEGNEPGRHETFLSCHDQFTLLVDQFKFPEPRPVELVIDAPSQLEGRRHRYRCSDGKTHFGVNVLGDYAIRHRSEQQLVLHQRLGHGRFLVAVTRDPEAKVRVLNGWAIEVRTGGHVYQLLHSNRSGKLRALGPVRTDARYALVDWPHSDDASTFMLNARLHVLQAIELHADLRDAQPPPAPDWVI